MKKVRFQSPKKLITSGMDEAECHFPRPFLERKVLTREPNLVEYKEVVYSTDPVHRFEYSDLSPYPLAKKTPIRTVNDTGPNWSPSSDLNLSMLDIHEPRRKPHENSYLPLHNERQYRDPQPHVLSSIENTKIPPNVLVRDDSFFIRRGEDDNNYNFNTNIQRQQLCRYNFDKENNVLDKKAKMVQNAMQLQQNAVQLQQNAMQLQQNEVCEQQTALSTKNTGDCNCHHCIQMQTTPPCMKQTHHPHKHTLRTVETTCHVPKVCSCKSQIKTCSYCEKHEESNLRPCSCSSGQESPKNTLDKKTWAIQKYEQSKQAECMDIEKQVNMTKEKREPTISDLLKIIKLQNEQLQLLQEKVDKFITASTNQPKLHSVPVHNYIGEHAALQTIESGPKISIGVMTSFEIVRTSTVINKEIIQTNDKNAQIQCNRSQISIKEVISEEPSTNMNFLDGITPIPKKNHDTNQKETEQNQETKTREVDPQTIVEEKTLNEQSLYNVQVDNAITPMMSPDQSLYLDVKDYSDSDSTSSEDQSNVGWTYYNKVMTHVNGMLQDSEMPSSASALYRNTRQQCVQMQIDKTNVSVMKRVKFGDDPLGLHQAHIYAGATDTSLKMNQLAAKYLHPAPRTRVAKPTTTPIDMSFATRNYMERHQLIQGVTSKPTSTGDIPRFLDITALKKQPKLL